MLNVQEVPTNELPDDAVSGFRLLGDEGETVMFFHWSPDDEGGTNYADVLEALPDRLEAMGHEDQAASIQGQVISIFGAGA